MNPSDNKNDPKKEKLGITDKKTGLKSLDKSGEIPVDMIVDEDKQENNPQKSIKSKSEDKNVGKKEEKISVKETETLKTKFWSTSEPKPSSSGSKKIDIKGISAAVNVLRHYSKDERKKLAERLFKSPDSDSLDSESPLIKDEKEVKVRKTKSLPDFSDTNQKQIQRYSSRIFPQEIWNKSRPNSFISNKVADETRRRAQKYLDKLEAQQLKLGNFIACGSYGYVVKGLYLNEGKIAVKIIDLTLSGKDIIEGDIKIFRELKHDNIISLIHSVLETDVLFLLMPFAETDLFFDIFENGAVSEKRSRNIIQQILFGLQFMHNKGYAHRDVKLENILIVRNKMKICDFDRTIKVIDETGNPIESKELRGTYDYMAPELLSGEGSKDLRLTDVWSSGILMFAIITYTYAFGPINRIRSVKSEKAVEKMKYSRYSYPKECIPSFQCQSFISQLLEYDQYSRMTLDQILVHEWFSIDIPDSDDRTFSSQYPYSLYYPNTYSTMTEESSSGSSGTDSPRDDSQWYTSGGIPTDQQFV